MTIDDATSGTPGAPGASGPAVDVAGGPPLPPGPTRAATRPVIGAVLVVAVLWDWLWRADVPSVASGLLTLAIVVLLATTTLLERRASVALAVAALTLLVLGAVRGSSAPTTRGATTACVC